MQLMPVVACLLSIYTLAQISFTLLLFTLAVLPFVFRPGQKPTLPSETTCLKPDFAEITLSAFTAKARGSMPSVLYRPPTKAYDRLPHPAPLDTMSEQEPRPTSGPQAEIMKQPYDAFLVLDVEATCREGSGFGWANEIIEWPVCLLRWKDKTLKGRASCLEVVAEFRSFVKPTWRPHLSNFCTNLTGVTQAQVNHAPTFPQVLYMFARFMVEQGLIDYDGKPLQRFCWCSDGPFDVQDFVVKQCFISNIPMPIWLRDDVLDARRVVSLWSATKGAIDNGRISRIQLPPDFHIRSLNLTQQLHVLGLPPFQGRLHCGMDDTRNVARIVIELARRGIRLEPNTPISPHKRWKWMGRHGQVLECFVH